MAVPETIVFISSQLNLICGSILFIVGSIGALLNMYTFRQRSLRTSSCSIYLFGQSFFDLCHLTSTLLTRILASLSVETYSKSGVYCRIRSFIAEVASLCAVSCLCLGAFDRCMSTSRKESHRRWSSHAYAYRLISITISVWTLVNIPQLVFRGLLGNSCASLSISFTLYLNYFHTPILYGVLPLSVLFYLRKRTMSNIQHIQHAVTARHRVERYINRLLLMQISLTLFTSLLLMAQYIYSSATISTPKDALHSAIENLCLQIVRLIFYLNYTTAYYINCLVSPEARRIFKNLFNCNGQKIKPLTTIAQGARD